jgi:pyridoxal phosphate enzyme (YggS family)
MLSIFAVQSLEMSVDQSTYNSIMHELHATHTTLIAVSKTKPVEDLTALYELGHREFGENYVQELVGKQAILPADIRWHFIGHLQSNKVKYIAPFVHLIHGVDSLKLLEAVDKEGRKLGRIVNCLLQVHIASEETKFGFDLQEARQVAAHYFLEKKFGNVKVCGLMGMASFTADQTIVENEFKSLKSLFDEIRSTYPDLTDDFNKLSMGMSGDYKLAIQCGSNMVRIGSLIFGSRN